MTVLRGHRSFFLLLPLFVGSYGSCIFLILSIDLCLSEYRECNRVLIPVLGVIKSVSTVVTVIN